MFIGLSSAISSIAMEGRTAVMPQICRGEFVQTAAFCTRHSAMYKNARQAAMPQICRGEFVQWGKKIPDKKIGSCRAFNVHKYDSQPRYSNRANGRALKVSKYDSFPRQSSSAAGGQRLDQVEGENASRRGYISNLPSSIAADKTNFDNAE